MANIKKVANISKECVACGCCVKVCRTKAIAVHKGLKAIVNGSACVGCGKCVKICPADVITLKEVEIYEKSVV